MNQIKPSHTENTNSMRVFYFIKKKIRAPEKVSSIVYMCLVTNENVLFNVNYFIYTFVSIKKYLSIELFHISDFLNIIYITNNLLSSYIMIKHYK